MVRTIIGKQRNRRKTNKKEESKFSRTVNQKTHRQAFVYLFCTNFKYSKFPIISNHLRFSNLNVSKKKTERSL